jgi:hypothetical protein
MTLTSPIVNSMKHFRSTLTKFDDVQAQALPSEKELKEILFYPHISFSLSNFLLQSSFEFVYIHTTQTFFFDSFVALTTLSISLKLMKMPYKANCARAGT